MFYTGTADRPLYWGSTERNSSVSHGESPTAHSITCDIKGVGDFRGTTPEKRLPLIQNPGGGTEVFQAKVYQRVRILLVEVYERIGKFVISACKMKAQNLWANRPILYL